MDRGAADVLKPAIGDAMQMPGFDVDASPRTECESTFFDPPMCSILFEINHPILGIGGCPLKMQIAQHHVTARRLIMRQ